MSNTGLEPDQLAARSGDEVGLSWEDLPELMNDLRDVAQRLLARWPGMQSLQPTLLVNTALRRQRRSDQSWDQITWETRQQFFGQVFRAMRHKLVEYRRQQETRGYVAQRRISVAEMDLFDAWRNWTEDPELALALEATLERLTETHPQLAELVQYRFFSGLTWNDIAKLQDCGLATVKRNWKKTRVLMQALINERLQTSPAP